MMISRRFKAGCLMTLLIGFCLGIGFVFGILAHQAWKKKTEQPEFMKWAAMNHLKKLEPTPEQLPKIEAKVDAAIAELMTFKAQALRNIWDILDRTSGEIDQDLTSEQKEQWSKIKPQRPVEVK
jgi:hypothetical protein